MPPGGRESVWRAHVVLYDELSTSLRLRRGRCQGDHRNHPIDRNVSTSQVVCMGQRVIIIAVVGHRILVHAPTGIFREANVL